MNRFEKAAERLQTSTDDLVHVEWAPANREYVVDGSPAANIREARKLARRQVVLAIEWKSVPASRLSRYRSHDGVPSVVS